MATGDNVVCTFSWTLASQASYDAVVAAVQSNPDCSNIQLDPANLKVTCDYNHTDP